MNRNRYNNKHKEKPTTKTVEEQEIKDEQQYKPPQEWVNSLIPATPENLYLSVPRQLK